MIINENVEVTINGSNKEYWNKLGYKCSGKDKIIVNQKELPNNSHVVEQRKCDCCGKIYSNTHQKLLRTYNSFNKDVCQFCQKNNEEIKKIKKEKTISTSFKKYGVESPNQSLKVKRNKEISSLKKYGVPYYSQTEESKEKSRNTCMEKYGVDHPSKTKEFQEKIHQTMINNGTVPTSSKQIELYKKIKNIYKENICEENFILSNVILDIVLFIEDIKIDIEYDGWYWHQDKRKDFRRDKFVQSQGFKVLRIKSGSLQPTDQQLKDAINLLIKEKERYYKEIVLRDYKN